MPRQAENYVGIVKLCKLSRKSCWNFQKKKEKRGEIPPTPLLSRLAERGSSARGFIRIGYAIFHLNGVHHWVLNTDNPSYTFVGFELPVL